MTKHFASYTPQRLAVFMIAIAVATVGLPARATSTETVNISPDWVNQDMAQLAASSGRLLLKRVEAAENMIESDQLGAARNELQAAETTAGAIKAMMPFVVVVDQIRDAKNRLLVEDADRFREDLLPIYARLDEMSLYAPKVAKEAKGHLKQAEDQVAKGKTQEAGKAMEAARERLTESTVYLPVDYVYGQVAAARIALSGTEPDAATAKRAVENAERSLVTVVTTVEDDQSS